MKKKFAYILSITTVFLMGLLFQPGIASAHVKWFVDADDVAEKSQSMGAFYGVTSVEVLIWAILVFVAVIIFSVLDSFIRTPKRLLAFGHRHEKGIVYVAQAVLGLFLIGISVLWNIILVPEYNVTDSLTSVLKVVQIVIGLMLIGNVWPRVATSVLFVMTLSLGFTHGLVTLAENALLLSLAVFFFIKKSPADSWWNRCDKHAIEIVRIGVAITLIVLAFTEKLMYPELSLSFLSVHDWNFMQPIFPWFTDKLFVLSTGFAELAFGVIFIFGYLTRINTVLIASFFAASVVTMAVQFQVWEVEDLVVYSAAILFVFYGHGNTKFFHAMWPNSWLHKHLFGRKKEAEGALVSAKEHMSEEKI